MQVIVCGKDLCLSHQLVGRFFLIGESLSNLSNPLTEVNKERKIRLIFYNLRHDINFHSFCRDWQDQIAKRCVRGKFSERHNNTTMTCKDKFLPTFLTVVTLTFLLACGQSNSNKNSAQTDNTASDDQALTIDTFSTFPPEIDGCFCYFSNDSTEFKKGEYVYMNDFAQTSFLKINGVLTKFTQTDFKEINKMITVAKAKSDKYELTIEVIDGIQSGDETALKSGTIKLADRNGKTITKTFYGECGC